MTNSRVAGTLPGRPIYGLSMSSVAAVSMCSYSASAAYGFLSERNITISHRSDRASGDQIILTVYYHGS